MDGTPTLATIVVFTNGGESRVLDYSAYGPPSIGETIIDDSSSDKMYIVTDVHHLTSDADRFEIIAREIF